MAEEWGGQGGGYPNDSTRWQLLKPAACRYLVCGGCGSIAAMMQKHERLRCVRGVAKGMQFDDEI
jgi:hypothetical protein